MNILLTGASGLVGSAFARIAAQRGHCVLGVVGGFSGAIDGVTEKRVIDLADGVAVSAALRDVFPHAIVNCAAIAAPEVCDVQPDRARALNIELPVMLAKLARRVNARFVHLSSEQVFDGKRTTPYASDDDPSPINLYGRQKLESEHAVRIVAGELAVTVRPPLLMGNSLGGRRGPHEALFANWVQGKPVKLYTDEFRQSCTAENLATVMLELCERNDLSGVFHWGGAELFSRYSLAVRIRDHFKLSEAQAPLVPITRADTPAIAERRPSCLALDISPLTGALKTRPQRVADVLEELSVPPPCRDWYSN